MNQKNLLKGEELCKECGLCCRGIFHTYAYLYTDDDIRIAKKENIPIIFNNEINHNAFTLPCPVFNGLCSIYSERPSVCGAHKCDLLESVLCDDITIEASLHVVKKMQDILNDILPELKDLTRNTASNNPVKLMNNAYDSLGDESSVNKFKKKHATLLIKYGVFNFLRHKYFYKKDDYFIKL